MQRTSGSELTNKVHWGQADVVFGQIDDGSEYELQQQKFIIDLQDDGTLAKEFKSLAESTAGAVALMLVDPNLESQNIYELWTLMNEQAE